MNATTPDAGIRARAGLALAEDDLATKAEMVRSLHAAATSGSVPDDSNEQVPLHPVEAPGRPARPELVEPRSLPRRRLGTPEGRFAAIHAVAHIEANAVNLALDAIHRFEGLPWSYRLDWLGVAVEEALHFEMLAGRLADLGGSYGDLPAHDGLWSAAVATAEDPLRRMALVPRVLEARGLDVTPLMLERFREVGDTATAAVLQRILHDEVGHVAIGDRWFRHLCAQRGLEPAPTFIELLDEADTIVPPPFNEEARTRAGFGAAELDDLARRHSRRTAAT